MAVAVVNAIEAGISPALNADYEFLQRCFDAKIEKNPQMQEDWSAIGRLIYSHSAPSGHSDPSSLKGVSAEADRLKKSLARARDIYHKLRKFKSDYVELIDDSQVVDLERLIELALSGVKSAESFQYFHQSDCVADPLKQLRFLKDGMDLLSESLPINFSRQIDLLRCGRMSSDDYEHSLNALRAFLVYLSNSVDQLVLSERGFGRLTEMQVLQKNIKDMAMSLLWQVSRISEGKEPLGYFLVDVGGAAVALESQSAEAKAIRRIHEGLADDEWELAYQPGDQIDVDDLDAQLRACGYID